MGTLQEYEHCQLHFGRIKLSIALKCSRKPDEPSIRAKSFRRIRRAGLAENRQRQSIELRAASCAVANRPSHPVGNDGSMRRSNVDLRTLDSIEIFGAGNL